MVGGEGGGAELARLWPPAGMPVLRDDEADLVLPESTTIIEYLDGLAGGARLRPAGAGAAAPGGPGGRLFRPPPSPPREKKGGRAPRPPGGPGPRGGGGAR